MDKNEKSTKAFTRILQAKLQELAQQDDSIAENLKKEGKKIEDCVQYILNTVQKSGQMGFTDDEIYSMAIHYYDEEKIDIGKPMQCFVVSNEKIVPTEEELKEIRQTAIRELIDEKKKEMSKKKEPPKPVVKPKPLVSAELPKVEAVTGPELKPHDQMSLF